ncbi:U-box domain-containing protein 7-like [Phragmites australis]|uniref:U-box domain-containing protein 7-like n=1 Tax=Phragmites australis TaxID=29695 RepID=UPI002D79A491|nr:U-box domain-containing protein 7-like [Phragmites australis]XP_062194615.1 U-box domain-containing protein 7-like [Phragmites australis]
MVARCAHADAGGFRLWPIFSAAALRRKVLEVLTCGGGGGRGGGGGSCRGRTAYRSPQRMPKPRPRSDRLAELLRAEPSECGGDVEAEADAVARKVEALEELKVVVGALQASSRGDHGGCMSQVEAAMAVRRKAKDDAGAREMLAMLGAIPPLVAVLDESDGGEEITAAAMYALLNLGIGNDTNKSAIVQAGAVHKMLRIAEGGASGTLTEAVVANFLCLSALDVNKPVIGASGAVPFLVRAFEGASTEQARHDALRALLNLSIEAANAPHLLAAGLAPALVAAVGDTSVTDRSLAALCNLVTACPEGRHAVSRAPDAVSSLVDVLNWSDEPGCQEKAAYVLMVLAHRSYGDRAAMAEAGVTSALLELTLVGTALAQKRASRILEILRADKGKQVADASGVVATVSAPQERGCREEDTEEGEPADACMSVEKRAVRQLVQQSLHSNMRRIVRRARLPQDLTPASSESLKALTASSTSKSLPF